MIILINCIYYYSVFKPYFQVQDLKAIGYWVRFMSWAVLWICCVSNAHWSLFAWAEKLLPFWITHWQKLVLSNPKCPFSGLLCLHNFIAHLHPIYKNQTTQRSCGNRQSYGRAEKKLCLMCLSTTDKERADKFSLSTRTHSKPLVNYPPRSEWVREKLSKFMPVKSRGTNEFIGICNLCGAVNIQV